MKLQAKTLRWGLSAPASWEVEEREWQPRARAALEAGLRAGIPVRVVGPKGSGRRELVARVAPHITPVDLDELGKEPEGVQVGLSTSGHSSHLFPIQAELELSDEPDAERVAAQVAALGRFTGEAVSLLVWDAVRRNRREGRMSLDLWPLRALAKETASLADGEVGAEHVQQALRARDERGDRHLRNALRSMEKGRYALALEGSSVGECNGLAVYTSGRFRYGKALRVSCAVGTGRGGIISIEKAVGLSGESHHKGIQVLAGYLREHHGRRRPLSFHATLTFEQSYRKISGDSASCAELLALLSALANAPLRQDLAVTGSVDQKGRLQSVGGAVTKIEGFWLAGGRGVVLPLPNVEDLVLRSDLLDAVEAGEFELHALRSVDEVFELLTGESAEGLHLRVGEELDALHQASKSGKK